MSRSIKKGVYIQTSILKKYKFSTKQLFIWSRRSTIPFSFINKQVYIHNGKTFKRINVTREKIGFKFGEFAFTKSVAKTNKKQIKKNKK